MKERLVLFDIDGTLIHGGRFWAECFMASFRECCAGREVRKIPFSGKTDRLICRELMQAVGMPPDEALTDRILRGYLDRARAGIAERLHELRVMPGVLPLIQELGRRSEVTLGLLTGNVREGACLKLGAAGLDAHFVTGVYGDDHWDRYELPAIAVRRAREELGLEVSGKQVVVIGDTIHDVGCGQKIGVRAIGVGTGQPDARARVLAAWEGRGEPGDPRPDHYFEDLSGVDEVLRAILG